MWLKKYRPKHALCPHKLDYCDTCAGLKKEIQSCEMKLKRIVQSGSSSAENIGTVEDNKKGFQESLENHKKQAHDSHESHLNDVKKCKEDWAKIVALERDPNADPVELLNLKNKFVLVIGADYQQSKLIPYWGYSPQPGVTYYLQKMNYDVFGIVDARDDKGYVYMIPETIGPKNTDHTMSYLKHYLTQTGAVPLWVEKIHLYMDNAGSTNKNFYMVGFCQELVQHGLFSSFRLSFMIAGHTKFSVDRKLLILIIFQMSLMLMISKLSSVSMQKCLSIAMVKS